MIPPLLAIFTFPVVALILFRMLALRLALVWTILLGYLFLPTGANFDLPLLPAIDKSSMPAIMALLLVLSAAPRTVTADGPVLSGWWPRDRIVLFLIALLLASSFLTALTNRDTLVYGGRILPGLSLYDGLSDILGSLLKLLPLLMARKYLSTEAGHRLLLKSLAIAGAIYSLPIIFELVMSPQLNRIVYGFFPHSWLQHIRNGGYRPLVFLSHGLWLGIFMSGTVLAAFVYARSTHPTEKTRYLALAGWLLLILVTCKTLGALGITLALLPAVLLLKPKGQLLVAAIICFCVMTYPALRGADLVPTQRIVDIAQDIDPDRAASIRFRFENEDMLLEKANQKSLFGWGGWGRSRIYDEVGRDVSVTDGFWVITIGLGGWTGYVSTLGLFCTPVLLLAFGRRRSGITLVTSGLCLVLTGNLIDLIPNSGISPITWLMVGALCGRLERGVTSEEAAADPADRRLRYSRFESGQPARPVRLLRPAGRPGRDPMTSATAGIK